MSCPTNTKCFQEWPDSGILYKNMNFTYDKLKREIKKHFKNDNNLVRYYIVNSIKYDEDDNILKQSGSAPNFQGGIITLCTCKHSMRCYKDDNEWKGVWIAGFSKKDDDFGQSLAYLMNVEESFISHYKLWKEMSVPIRKAKAADKHPLGDMFRPVKGEKYEFHLKGYKKPTKNHSHAKECLWHKDINYTWRINKKRPRLLVGNQKYSYLWNKPKIELNETIMWGDRHYNEGILSFLKTETKSIK